MSLKRIPTDEEIETLAADFRSLWRQGDVIRPWFRKHRNMLLEMVHGNWSWAAIARALTKAGITYRTGKPWTAKWLQSDFGRAQQPLKGYARHRRISEHRAADGEENELPAPAPSVFSENENADDDPQPEFKLAQFIDWDEKRAGANNGTRKASPASDPPSQRYAEIMEQLTGKKPQS